MLFTQSQKGTSSTPLILFVKEGLKYQKPILLHNLPPHHKMPILHPNLLFFVSVKAFSDPQHVLHLSLLNIHVKCPKSLLFTIVFLTSMSCLLALFILV